MMSHNKCLICHKSTKNGAKGFCRPCYNKKNYNNILKNKRSTPNGKFKLGIRQAKIRNLEWTLTFEDYSMLIDNRCYYCKGLLNPMGVSLDRTDSSQGYTIENCVPCCRNCNVLKSDILSHDEMVFISQARKLYKFKTERKNGNS